MAPRVYPRVCGGTLNRSARYRRPYGLSPRVRGNRGRACASNGNPGSIPACAGEPTEHLIYNAATTVYPRVCGGTGALLDLLSAVAGLSPRVRGNPDPVCPSTV